MSKFSEYFKARKFNKLLTETQSRVEKENKPYSDIGLAIITASTNARDSIKHKIKATNEKERIQSEMYIFFEFVYFYTHMTLRSAFGNLTELQIEKLQNFLGPLLSGASIDSYCKHWPEDLKERLKSDFYNKLNDAEIEYSEATKFESKEPNQEKRIAHKFRVLFMTLCKNILSLAGYEDNDDIADTTSVYIFALNEYTNMNLNKLILNIKLIN